MKELQQKILKLLKTSTIPEHDKEMVELLLPIMKPPVLKSIHATLASEKDKMFKLNQKQKRIECKYRVMVEKLARMELDK